MTRLVAGVIGWAGFGVIVVEVVNHAGILGFRLNMPLMVIAILILYLLYEFTLLQVQAARKLDPDSQTLFIRVGKGYMFLLGLAGLCFLISIPFVWWGVIKQLAMTAAGR